MLNHVVKILSLVRTKTKFLAMLAVPSDPALADLAGTLDARRKFADALPAAYIAPVLRVATASNLGTQRRCAALEVVRETAALAGAAASQDPEAAARTALSQAVDADLLATVAASTGSDIILRKASMDALRAAAGGDLATYGEPRTRAWAAPPRSAPAPHRAAPCSAPPRAQPPGWRRTCSPGRATSQCWSRCGAWARC